MTITPRSDIRSSVMVNLKQDIRKVGSNPMNTPSRSSLGEIARRERGV